MSSNISILEKKLFINKYKPTFLDDYILDKSFIETLKILIQIDKLNILFIGNTGSGKTLAFCVQLELQLQKDVFNGQVLILCPTRELAGQVAKNYAKLT